MVVFIQLILYCVHLKKSETQGLDGDLTYPALLINFALFWCALSVSLDFSQLTIKQFFKVDFCIFVDIRIKSY